MVIEDIRAGRSFLLCLHSELLPALICEGFIDASYKTFQRASLDFCLCLRRVRPTSFFEAVLFCSFHWCVISFLFCLCLQGWPMNRQLRKGPQIFHRSVSESRASLPRAGVAPSPGLPPQSGGAGACTLFARTAIISYRLEFSGASFFFFFLAIYCEAALLNCIWDDCI